MSRSAFRRGFAWVLALVLVRSLVPAGYMPGLVDGRLSIVLCESHHAHHQRHHDHQRHQDHQPDQANSGVHHADGDCAYAQSASPALLAAIDLSPPGQQFLSWTVRRFDPGLPISEPPRYSAARGPPAGTGV